MAQARGRSRKRKAGLRPVPGVPPSAEANNAAIDKANAEIIAYLKDELETYKQQPGMYKEVVAIGRALQQLRSTEPNRPTDEPAPSGPDPHDRSHFGLPDTLSR